ncbi:MAG: NUDIX hydrolase [Chloroflexi bacterium]|nr:NUDIX hydrolase [Chloroflexota bacterium]|tara:strand:+ start:4371 stop:4823 length:453 start_codon:yes stop_codon:yes gene_type:complete
MAKNKSDALHQINIWAAGGVIINQFSNNGNKVLICHRKKENLWCLPKGKPEDGETIEETALREVKEETGLDTHIIEKINEINYIFLNDIGKKIHKKVHFFLMESKGGNIQYHDKEFDNVIWEGFEVAKTLLTYENELDVLEKAIEMVPEE